MVSRSPGTQRHVHILTHSLHYGVAAFEGSARTSAPTARRTSSASTSTSIASSTRASSALLQPKFTREQIIAACVETLRANGMTEGYLRPLLPRRRAMGIDALDNPVRPRSSSGSGARISARKRSRTASARRSRRSRATTSTQSREGQDDRPVHEQRARQARGEVRRLRRSDPARRNGYVSKGSGENIFLVKRGRAPHAGSRRARSSRASRATPSSARAREGLAVEETRITRDQLWLADEVFFTGTAAEVTPIREDRRSRDRRGAVGPITRRLQARFFDIVRGTDTSHPEWLTKV